jgi:dihydroflavonol-4-reductase
MLHDLHERGVRPVAHVRASSDVRYIDALGLEKRVADLTDAGQITGLLDGIDAVIHNAAYVNFRQDRLERFHAVNTQAAVALYQEAKRAGVRRFLQVSSIIGIGAQPLTAGPVPLNETFEFNLGHLKIPYIMTKRAAEDLLRAFAEDSGPELTIVNLPKLVAASRKGDDRGPALKWFGKPWLPTFSNHVNLADIRDVSIGVIEALEKGRARERYLLGGDNVPVSEVLKTAAKILGKSPRYFTPPRSLLMVAAHAAAFVGKRRRKGKIGFYPDLVRMMDYHWVYSSEKARKEIGYTWRPLGTTLEDLLTNRFTGTPRLS